MQGRNRQDGRPLHPYNAGKEHVGFPPTRKALLGVGGRTRIMHVAVVPRTLGPRIATMP